MTWHTFFTAPRQCATGWPITTQVPPQAGAFYDAFDHRFSPMT
jgi:hypothetical protein